MPVDGTVNITVPVVATDVAALPDTTKYAAALSLTIDSATFIVTGQLKDQNGNNLGAAQTIDLPLESVVVGGSYNSQTQKVVLTLQNGKTIEFSVADLVYGLQTELSETNKLNPAYINYDSTHRAVSDTEKSEWNGKQDVIDSSHKLSADFVDDTNAANKFATEEELEQIETNKNNISLIDEKIFKSLNVENNQIATSEADSAGKSKKWIVAYLPSKATITELKQLITVNDITKIKCEIWEKNDDKYTLAQTILPETISTVSAGYVVTFANITTNKESLVTYTDTSASGCIGFKFVSGYNCDKFSADLVEVTDNDISATNTIKIFYSIKYRYTVLNKDVYVVDGSGNGDYTTVTRAVSELPSGATIFVKPGTYAENIRAFTKRVNIIGADRYKCILQSTDGRYANPVLECCCGYIANLTLQSKYINGTSQEIPTTELGAYAVHCENNGENDEFAIGNCLTFVNCDLMSDFFPALGVGCFKDWSLNIINCRLVSNQTAARAKYGADGGLGALYFHTMIGDSGIAKINIKDTIIQTTVLENTVCAYDLDTPESGIVCELIDNTLYSAVNGFTDSIWWRGITTPFGSKISLSPISNGNTGTVFNS